MEKIEIIDRKFLESGLSHMEFGAVHSTIERAKKTGKIFIPSQWNTVIQTARTAAPYVGVQLSHEDCWDFKNVATSRFCNTRTDMKGDRVNWLTTK